MTRASVVRRTRRDVVRRTLAGAALLASFAAVGANGPQAVAAPCPAGLAVAPLGVAPLPVSGSDCVTRKDGAVDITAPVLGAAGGVNLTTLTGGAVTMTLSANRLTLSGGGPAVRVNAGGNPALAGAVTVGKFRFCDLALPSAPPPAGGPAGAAPPVAGRDIEAQEVNCRDIAGVQVDLPNVPFAKKLGGLAVAINDLKPAVLLVSDAEGGQVAGTFSLTLPRPLDRFRAGIGVKVSRDGGVGLTQAAVLLRTPLPLGPGIFLRDVGLSFNPSQDAFAATGTLQIVPVVSIRGDLAIAGGALQRLGATLTFAPPLPLFQPPIVSLTKIGVLFQAGSAPSPIQGTEAPGLPVGLRPTAIVLRDPDLETGGGAPSPTQTPSGTVSTPAGLTGTIGFVAGPRILGAAAFNGEVSATVGGGRMTLRGSLSAVANKIKLAQVRALVERRRFELEGQVNALAGVLVGRVFAGVTPTAFTGEGKVTFAFPKSVRFVGGRKIASAEGLVSNIGAAGIVSVDLLLFTGTVGARIRFSNGDVDAFVGRSKFDAFRTVRPSGTLSASGVGGVRVGGGLRFPRGLGPVIVEVRGPGRAPRDVQIVNPAGLSVTPAPVRIGDRLLYALRRPQPGLWRVLSRDPFTATAIDARFPFLDPDPGYGSRPRAPVTAGTPVTVCWTVKNAPPGARVTLFEDRNGRLGTGRLIAADLGPNACQAIPTAELEPGRHWVYGVVTVNNLPLTSRYWPIGIDVTDPAAPAPPEIVGVRPVRDGVAIDYRADPAAAAFLRVRAEPLRESDIPPDQTDVEIDPTLPADALRSAEISLRGVPRWRIRLQAVGPDGTEGNLSPPVVAAPSSPVVLAGTPNDVAPVGRRWLFQLRAAPTMRLRLVRGPRGMTVDSDGLLRWTPSAAAGSRAPQEIVVRGCTGDGRCLDRRWFVSALSSGVLPIGPSRGFDVVPGALRSDDVAAGATVLIKARGIDAPAVVRIDGRTVGAVPVDQATLRVTLPRDLGVGPHDVRLRVGQDAEEVELGTLNVYPA